MTRATTTRRKAASETRAPEHPEGQARPAPKRGSLVVIGTGIRTVGQLTLEAIAWMQRADTLLYVVGDPIAEEVMRQQAPNGAESMAGYYKVGEPRINAYNAMIERILTSVRAGNLTVGAFYGHPGVFAYPSHESIRRARAEGYSATMLPGISAEDCLFADLGVDPAVSGCQSYEATDFLLNAPMIDVSAQLILWQIGTLGDWTYQTRGYNTGAMPLLVERLRQLYPPGHPLAVYEAPMLPGTAPMIAWIPLEALPAFPITAAMTLYVPPARARAPDALMLQRFAQMMG
jgi:hypothetical protein